MKTRAIRFIDLFCGIGGFRVAAERLGWRCVFSSDIDPAARRAYAANFGEEPFGDVAMVHGDDVPNHDVLLGGFPCQPFSIIGERKGFEDMRGTLVFEAIRIMQAKRPRAFVLENVKQLRTHNGGKTLARILEALESMGYRVEWRILNALDFGLPQKRERVFIVGTRGKAKFEWPEGGAAMAPLASILESEVDDEHVASKQIQKNRRAAHREPHPSPAVWHENKSGNISSHPYSCALRAGASFNYLLVDGVRRFTPRELLRLQGFPDSYQIVCGTAETRKQAGNAVAVPVVEAVLGKVHEAIGGKGRGTEGLGTKGLGTKGMKTGRAAKRERAGA